MTDFDPDAYPAAQRHETLREVAPDVYFAGGTMKMKPLVTVSRNMVVVRSGEALTLVNPIRLSAAGERELEALGTVKHAIRLGLFHGYDDAYTVARFGAQFWCQAGSGVYREPTPDQELSEDGPLPIPDAQLLVFRNITKPECALLINRGNGLLLTADSLQHYGNSRRESLGARVVMPFLGFGREALVGPLWLKMLTPKGGSVRPDFERLLKLDFDALITAHGVPLMEGARAAVDKAVDKAKFEA